MREQRRRWAELAHALQPDAPDLIPAIRGPRAQQLIGLRARRAALAGGRTSNYDTYSETQRSMVRPTGQINAATSGWNAGRSIQNKKGRPYPGEYSILKGRCCHLDADGMDRSADFPDDGGRTPCCAPARKTPTKLKEHGQ